MAQISNVRVKLEPKPSSSRQRSEHLTSARPAGSVSRPVQSRSRRTGLRSPLGLVRGQKGGWRSARWLALVIRPDRDQEAPGKVMVNENCRRAAAERRDPTPRARRPPRRRTARSLSQASAGGKGGGQIGLRHRHHAAGRPDLQEREQEERVEIPMAGARIELTLLNNQGSQEKVVRPKQAGPKNGDRSQADGPLVDSDMLVTQPRGFAEMTHHAPAQIGQVTLGDRGVEHPSHEVPRAATRTAE